MSLFRSSAFATPDCQTNQFLLSLLLLSNRRPFQVFTSLCFVLCHFFLNNLSTAISYKKSSLWKIRNRHLLPISVAKTKHCWEKNFRPKKERKRLREFIETSTKNYKSYCIFPPEKCWVIFAKLVTKVSEGISNERERNRSNIQPQFQRNILALKKYCHQKKIETFDRVKIRSAKIKKFVSFLLNIVREFHLPIILFFENCF